jgi:hypothetical protein
MNQSAKDEKRNFYKDLPVIEDWLFVAHHGTARAAGEDTGFPASYCDRLLRVLVVMDRADTYTSPTAFRPSETIYRIIEHEITSDDYNQDQDGDE